MRTPSDHGPDDPSNGSQDFEGYLVTRVAAPVENAVEELFDGVIRMA